LLATKRLNSAFAAILFIRHNSPKTSQMRRRAMMARIGWCVIPSLGMWEMRRRRGDKGRAESRAKAQVWREAATICGYDY
jgi:hypothetical protein